MNGSRFQERRTNVSDENNHARTLKEQRATITSATRPFPERKAVASVKNSFQFLVFSFQSTSNLKTEN